MEKIIILLSKILIFLAPLFSKKSANKNKGTKTKLKVLLIGYNGANSFGAELRVSELIKQVYQKLGRENIHVGILSLSKSSSEATFEMQPDEIIQISSFFHKDLILACSRYDVGVLCEGNCFLTNYSNILTIFMATAAGILKRQKKQCFAYGIDFGNMEPFVKKFVLEYSRQIKVATRSVGSLKIATEEGFNAKNFTDTAWTYETKTLQKADNKNLGIAITNPFSFPIKASLWKFLAYKILGKYRESHFEKFYFLSNSNERTKLFEKYQSAIGELINHARNNGYDVTLFGLEKFDIETCKSFGEKFKANYFASKRDDPHKIAKEISKMTLMFSCDYHGKVIPMLFGIPTAAISKDERLSFLFEDIKYNPKLIVEAKEENLSNKLIDIFESLELNRAHIIERDKIYIEKSKKQIDEMTKYFSEAINL